jgi:hypothetical protein
VAVVLLIGSGRLLQSVRRLARVDSGFDPRGVLVLPVFLDSQAYRTGEHSRRYFGTLFERLSAVPGILSVGGATTVSTSPPDRSTVRAHHGEPAVGTADARVVLGA